MNGPGYQGLSTPRRRPMTPGRRDHVLPSFNSPASAKVSRLLGSAYSGPPGMSLSLDEELPMHVVDQLASEAVTTTSEEYEAPRVWFQKDEDRRQNSEFIRRVDEMVQEVRRLILERTGRYEKQAEEGRERDRQIMRDMEALEAENKGILSALKEEHGEEEELSRGISGLQVRQREVKEVVNQLSSQVARLETELEKKQKAIDEKRRVLGEQAEKNRPEVEFFEKRMGVTIDNGGDDDTLTFAFTLISLSEPLRPFSITVSMAQREYRVTRCTPKIRDIDRLVDELNSSRDFFAFIKRVRKAFVDQYHEELS
ncbi:kinetochore-associated Ndc80 complex subunit spc25 [Coemansia erecta]|uniref:Kinetochore protein SPC25 n=1 Tax=Coemansia erecta TaxID=147472 RepID=A0A9W8CPA6_9FUNG|nr:kinetochore-associated Ndc80 complex subunit spc25 [Coemansia erecta]